MKILKYLLFALVFISCQENDIVPEIDDMEITGGIGAKPPVVKLLNISGPNLVIHNLASPYGIKQQERMTCFITCSSYVTYMLSVYDEFDYLDENTMMNLIKMQNSWTYEKIRIGGVTYKYGLDYSANIHEVCPILFGSRYIVDSGYTKSQIASELYEYGGFYMAGIRAEGNVGHFVVVIGYDESDKIPGVAPEHWMRIVYMDPSDGEFYSVALEAFDMIMRVIVYR